MDTNGKLTDVIVDDNIGVDLQTGMPKVFGFFVWADPNMKEVILKVPGVHNIAVFGELYIVNLSPRYDREWIRQEIIAQIKINS